MTGWADRPGPDAALLAEHIARRGHAGPVTSTWVDGPATGYGQVILARLRGGLRDGTVPGCPHGRTFPLLVWFPAPGCPVGCYPCVTAWILANVAGTPEDAACDICRQPADVKTARSMIFRLGVDQAITITYSVCDPCAAIEEQP